MKNLILLTNFFPYGNGEPYLETEVKYYEKYFNRIYVASLQLRKKDLRTCRALPSDNFKLLPVAKAPNYVYLLYSFRVLGDANLYIELKKLYHENRISYGRMVQLFVYLSRSYYEAKKIKCWFKKIGLLANPQSGIIYSYRFEYQPYVGLLLKKWLPNYKIVSRGHGFDLYEERRPTEYIPLREYLLNNLDKTVMIAQDGVDYLTKKYPAYKNKIVLYRLGTLDHGLSVLPSSKDKLHIVSCSTVSGVKRVHLIVEALAKVQKISVCWDHYGEGALLNEIRDLAAKSLPPNIEYTFHGYIDNTALLAIYRQNPFHWFINVSSSEGIPVSIMEAMSFGIPCIATNVGGTKEVVEDGKNGILLPCDFKPEKLAVLLESLGQMNEEEYLRYRDNARLSWMENYSADKNYRKFVVYLKGLCK